jgi:hypothetical protein
MIQGCIINSGLSIRPPADGLLMIPLGIFVVALGLSISFDIASKWAH